MKRLSILLALFVLSSFAVPKQAEACHGRFLRKLAKAVSAPFRAAKAHHGHGHAKRSANNCGLCE